MKLGGSSITLGFPKIVLARVSSEVANTNKFVWAMKMGGNAVDRILDLAYDGSGGVWLVGYQGSGMIAFGNTCLANALVAPGQSCPSWSSSSYPDGGCPHECAGPRAGVNFLVRVDSSGNVVHATSVGSNSGTAWSDTMSTAHAACDSSGNLYVAGELGASMTFRAGIHTVSTGPDTKAVLFKYNAATLDFDWAIPCGIGAGGPPDVRGLVYGSSGLYVAGDVYHGTTAFGGHSVTSSMFDPFVARFSESGVAQWVVTARGTGPDYMKAIDADATGAGVWVLTQMGYVAGTSSIVGSSSFASMTPHTNIAFHVDSAGAITNAAMIYASAEDVAHNVHSIAGVSDGYYLSGDKTTVGTVTLGSQTLTTSMGAYVAHYSTSINDFDAFKRVLLSKLR